jgi:hypothetical protein
MGLAVTKGGASVPPTLLLSFTLNYTIMTQLEYEEKNMLRAHNLTVGFLFREEMTLQISQHDEILQRIHAANKRDENLRSLLKIGKMTEAMIETGTLGRPGFFKSSDVVDHLSLPSVAELLEKGTDVSNFGNPVEWQREQRGTPLVDLLGTPDEIDPKGALFDLKTTPAPEPKVKKTVRKDKVVGKLPKVKVDKTVPRIPGNPQAEYDAMMERRKKGGKR